jgi:hypothetical protein
MRSSFSFPLSQPSPSKASGISGECHGSKALEDIKASSTNNIIVRPRNVAQPQSYTFTTIEDPDADTPNVERTNAFGMNNVSDIVGRLGRHGFLYSGGVFTTIDARSWHSKRRFEVKVGMRRCISENHPSLN